jgi:hypothetical protein
LPPLERQRREWFFQLSNLQSHRSGLSVFA